MVKRACCAVLMILMTVIFSAGVVMAKEPATPEVSLQEAVDRALELSKSLKMAELEKDKASEQRGDAQKEVKYTPTGMVNPEIESAYATLLQSELNYQIKSKSYSALQEDIQQQVVDKYSTVLSAREARGNAQAAYKKAEWDKRMSQLKLQVGILSQLDMTGVNTTFEQKQSALVQAEQDLGKAYVEFNALTGFWPEDRPQLVTDISYEPINVTSFTAEVNRAIDNNPDVWAALQNVTIERQDLRMALQPYDIEKIEIEMAELSADEAEDELEKQLILLYHDIVSLEGGIKAAEQGISAAEEALEAAQLKVDIGMGTEGDLLQAEANLKSAKSTLVGLKASHSAAMAAYFNLTSRDVLPAETPQV